MPETGIVIWTGSSRKFVAISDGLHRESIQAARAADAILSIEQKYRILVDNFEELEKNVLELALGFAIHSVRPGDINRGRLLVNRRVANLLSSARLYVDGVPHDLSAASRAPGAAKEAFVKLLNANYDGRLSYRVCEALRNYAQHRGLPVHGFGFSWKRNPENRAAPVDHAATLQLSPSMLVEDGGFKAKVLAEFPDPEKAYDLKHALREYLADLSHTHVELRKLLAADASWVQATFDRLADLAVDAGANDPNGRIALAIKGDDGIPEETDSVRKTFGQTHAELVLGYSEPISLDLFRVTSI